MLRAFYKSYGKRHLLSGSLEGLAVPGEFFLDEWLIFGIEYAGVHMRALHRDTLKHENPPVYTAWNGEELDWKVSHEKLSDYLDALSYFHALYGRALHGGVANERVTAAKEEVLQQHWKRIEIKSVPLYLVHDSELPSWPIYIREGQVLGWYREVVLVVASRTHEDLDEIRDILQVTWEAIN
jgi:hypothetical protein